MMVRQSAVDSVLRKGVLPGTPLLSLQPHQPSVAHPAPMAMRDSSHHHGLASFLGNIPGTLYINVCEPRKCLVVVP